jgi:hypothetical protein
LRRVRRRKCLHVLSSFQRTGALAPTERRRRVTGPVPTERRAARHRAGPDEAPRGAESGRSPPGFSPSGEPYNTTERLGPCQPRCVVRVTPMRPPRRRALREVEPSFPMGRALRRLGIYELEDKKIAPVDREQIVRPPGRVTLGSLNIPARGRAVNLRCSYRCSTTTLNSRSFVPSLNTSMAPLRGSGS